MHTSLILNVFTCSKQQRSSSLKCFKVLCTGQNEGVPYLSPDTKLSKQLNTAFRVTDILKQMLNHYTENLK